MSTDIRSAGYRMVQAVQNRELDGRQWAKLIGGSLLTGYGLSRGSLVGTGLALLGGRMVYRLLGEFTGNAPPSDRAPWNASRYAHVPPSSVRDKVDEASWESFPASDSPAYY